MLHFFAGALAVLGLSLMYCHLSGRSLAETVSASVCTVIMTLYAMSVVSVPLRLACALVMAAGWGCLVWRCAALLTGRCAPQRMNLAAAGVFAFCALFACTYLFDKQAIGWDEFSHWMLTLKNMFHFNSLGLGEMSSTEYQSYPPAIQLFEIFHLVFYPDFRESGAFMARTLLLTSLLIGPAFHKAKRPVTAAVKFLILFLSPIAFYGSAYSMLYIDAALGFLFAHLLWLYMSEERFDRFFVFHFALSGAVLVLVKGTGIALYLLALMVLLADLLIGRNERLLGLLRARRKRCLTCAALLIAVPLAALLSWSVYQRIHGISSFWQAQSSINPGSLLELIRFPKAYQVQTLGSFLYSYKSRFRLGVLPVSFALYPVYFIVLCVLAGICARRIRRGAVLGAALSVSYWAFVSSILATYLLLFPEVEAVVLSSFRRYMNTQALACGLFTLSLLLNPAILSDETALDAPVLRLRRCQLTVRRLLPFLLALSFPILSGSASSLVRQYLNARSDAASVTAHRAQHAHLIRVAEAIEDKEAQIYYLHQSVNDGHYQMARLHVAPIRLNRRDFCIAAAPEHAFDTYTAIKSPQAWSDELAAFYDYVYLDLVDDAFVSDYSALFESPDAIASHALYAVVPPQEEGGLVLLRLLDRE